MPIPDILRLLVKKNIFVTAATAPWNAKTDAKGLENPWMDAVLSIYCGGCTAMNVISYIRNCQIFSLNSNILKLRSLKIPKTDTLLLKTAMRRRLKWPCSDGRHGLLPSALSSTLFYVRSVLSRKTPFKTSQTGRPWLAHSGNGAAAGHSFFCHHQCLKISLNSYGISRHLLSTCFDLMAMPCLFIMLL